MSSTQVTEMNRGISLAIKVYQARLFPSELVWKSMSPFVELSSGGQRFKSFPSKKEGLSFSWCEHFALELEDPNDVVISLIQHRLLLKNTLLGEIKIPYDWFLKGKSIGWWEVFAGKHCVGKLLIGFVTDESFKDLELERLQVRFNIANYLAKLKNVKNHRILYKNKIRELQRNSEQDTKIYLSNVKSEREYVQLRIQQVTSKIDLYVKRMKDSKDTDRHRNPPVASSNCRFAPSKKQFF